MPTTAQNRQDAVESDYAPLYAVAGLADLALHAVKDTLTSRIAEARARQAEMAERAAARRTQVLENAEGALKAANDLPAQLRTMNEQLRSLPEVAREQLVNVQKLAELTYADVAGRGKVAVDGAVLNARKLQAQAAARAARVADEAADTATDVTEAADRLAEDAKATTGAARRTTARKAGGRTTAANRAAASSTPSPRAPRKAAERATSPSTGTTSTSTRKAPARKASPRKTSTAQ